MQGRDQGNVPEEVSFINTQLSGRYDLTAQGIIISLALAILVGIALSTFRKIISSRVYIGRYSRAKRD